jgi:long-chain acyl-CoA synthetase
VIVPDDTALRERGVVNIRELIRFELEGLSVSLPPHKRILGYDVWLEPLPRTTTGKLKRPEIERRVREHAATADAPDKPLNDAERQWLRLPDRATLVAAIAGRLDKPSVRPDANLELDLSLDSMERVELLTLLERRMGTRVAPDTRATIFTVRQLVDAVIAAPKATTTDAGGPAAASGDAMPWEAMLSAPPDPAVVAPLRQPKRIRAAFFFVVLQGARAIARVWLGFRVRGKEHLPHDGPFLICPNHLAYVDGFFLAAALPARLLRQVFFVGAAEYFVTPGMKWWAEAVNIVPVDPDANLVTAMQAGATGLRLGKVLILFPEGERSIDGEVKRFKKGAAILASTLDVPIVPLAIDGVFDLWPRGRPFNWRALLPWRAKRVTLEFGAPLAIAKGQEDAETVRLRQVVVALRDKIRS